MSDENFFVVAAQAHPNETSGLIDHGTRIADGDFRAPAFFMHNGLRAPRFAGIGRALHKQIQIAVIAAAGFATFAKGKQRALFLSQ